MLLDPREPVDRAVLEAARSWGVAPSVFLGISITVTEYRHNDAGQVVQSFTESPWTDDDRANALALGQYEATLCPGCNAPLDETTAADAEENYVPQIALCHRCVTIHQRQETLKDHPHPEALLIGAVRRPHPDEAPQRHTPLGTHS